MKGFTLIELLVVVLIIGILSAVALPQYTKAVEKSRAAQALAVLKSFGQAMENYYLANGTYVTRFDELDMDFPWSGTEKWYSLATDTRSNGEWSLQIINDGGYPGVYIGRLKGKYKGGGFGFFLNDKAKYGDYRVVCLERHRDGVTLTGKAGDYCARVMGGKPLGSAGGTRGYVLP